MSDDLVFFKSINLHQSLKVSGYGFVYLWKLRPLIFFRGRLLTWIFTASCTFISMVLSSVCMTSAKFGVNIQFRQANKTWYSYMTVSSGFLPTCPSSDASSPRCFAHIMTLPALNTDRCQNFILSNRVILFTFVLIGCCDILLPRQLIQHFPRIMSEHDNY